MWVKSDVANNVWLRIVDGSNTNSSKNVGTGWEWLEVTATISATPTTFTINIISDGSATTYLSQPMLVFGNSIGSGNYAPRPGDNPENRVTSFETVDTNSVGISSALYMASDGNFDEADADAAATMPCSALALQSGTGVKEVMTQGYITNYSWSWTVGGLIYASTTAGELTQTAPSGSGDQVQVVGFATHTDRIFFNPNYMLIEIA